MSAITDAGRIVEIMADLFGKEKHREVMLLGEVGLMLDPEDRIRCLMQEKMSVSGYWCGNERGKELGSAAAEHLSLDRTATRAQREFARQCSTWFSAGIRNMLPSARIEPHNGNDPATDGIPTSCSSTVISVDGFVPVTAPVELAGGSFFLVRETVPMQWGSDRQMHRFVRYDGGRLSSISPRFYFLSMEGEKAVSISAPTEDGSISMHFTDFSGTMHLVTADVAEMAAIMRRIPRYGSGPGISVEDEIWLGSVTNRPMQDLNDLGRLCNAMRGSGISPHPIMEKNWHAMLGIHHATMVSESSDLVLHISSSWNHPFLGGMAGSGYTNLACFSMTDDFLGNLGNVAYNHADCTNIGLPDSSVSFISCCDVAEQGVSLPDFLAESSRLLKPGGYLLMSLDYWQDPLETRGMVLKGSTPSIADRSSIMDIVRTASDLGMVIDGPLDLGCKDRTISWGDMDYTVLSLLLKRV
jgi:hypothetical protein